MENSLLVKKYTHTHIHLHTRTHALTHTHAHTLTHRRLNVICGLLLKLPPTRPPTPQSRKKRHGFFFIFTHFSQRPLPLPLPLPPSHPPPHLHSVLSVCAQIFRSLFSPSLPRVASPGIVREGPLIVRFQAGIDHWFQRISAILIRFAMNSPSSGSPLRCGLMRSGALAEREERERRRLIEWVLTGVSRRKIAS